MEIEIIQAGVHQNPPFVKPVKTCNNCDLVTKANIAMTSLTPETLIDFGNFSRINGIDGNFSRLVFNFIFFMMHVLSLNYSKLLLFFLGWMEIFPCWTVISPGLMVIYPGWMVITPDSRPNSTILPSGISPMPLTSPS